MISIIGAGPAGSYLAYLLAKQGKEVTLIEEHEKIGSPVQCTGIVTASIKKFFDIPDNVIANKCSKVIVISKNNRIEAKTDEIVMWRNKFDEFLAYKAQDEGVKILANHQFIGFNGKHSIKIKDKNNNRTKELIADYIIGADGPSSAVGKAAGLEPIKRFYIGMQAKVKLKTDISAFETYFSNNDFPYFFGWVVPESENTARLGLGAFENAKELFYKFLEKRAGKKEILCWESGIFPLYDPKKIIQKENVYLIGDAATQVKATTGGGIIPSLKAAEVLCYCIINEKDYNREFKKRKAGKELALHLKIRNTLNRFSDNDYDYLLSLMNQERIKNTLKKYDRDQPIPLVINLLLKEPRFLKFSKFLF
ncbi:NAD(P)/FAD-dependent oxidoreductase [Candidatus Woesearchaeota archaeon]|nr:NAD(P)/FAD-dependent oxidoreductase [Candidatus Woesearchaeota archaeon]